MNGVYFMIGLCLMRGCYAELYKSISEVVHLLETQKIIIDSLEDYYSKEDERHNTLKRYLDTFNKEHNIAMENITNYLGNPINAFKLIKRLSIDVKDIHLNIQNEKEQLTKMLKILKDFEYPAEEDLLGAAQSLSKLQSKYKWDIRDLADGKLNGVTVYQSTPMTPSDCFELGRALYNEHDYKNALAWILIALEKLRADPQVNHNLETDIIEYIATYNFNSNA